MHHADPAHTPSDSAESNQEDDQSSYEDDDDDAIRQILTEVEEQEVRAIQEGFNNAREWASLSDVLSADLTNKHCHKQNQRKTGPKDGNNTTQACETADFGR